MIFFVNTNQMETNPHFHQVKRTQIKKLFPKKL